MNITIKDVAKRANVSIATVSRVLNGSKPVSLKVKERVLEAIEEMGFNPNPVARSLIMKTSSLIGVLIPDIKNSFFANFVSGVEEECFKANYTTLLCNTNGNLDTELHYLNLLREKYIDGVIILTSSPNKKQRQVDFFEKHSIPVVYAAHVDKENDHISCINIDDFQAFYDGTKFLIDSGHRLIAMFSGPLSYFDSGYMRYKGYRQALADHGIDYQEKWFFEGEYDIQSGYKRGKELLKQKDKPTAICCVSDMVAIGAIRAAEELGLKVPEDISILGFDDIPIAEAYRPSLTTVRQPIVELGIQSAQMLLQQMQEKDQYVKEVRVLSHEIIVRESCLKLN
ncbi:LacI family DNA-binding transcriptional regulator [Bacillus sp. 03113]|uniref:LacI family DNA-binding transcriptional regulator n=1 Tax=Bacillus sp. 03113 TaxID=2578211 RepID=UPI001142FBDC|nr:LacI family DNA-binding transcriptional regulator [Bacillus sp. 03113]